MYIERDISFTVARRYEFYVRVGGTSDIVHATQT